MHKAFRVTVTTAAIGMAALLFVAPAYAGHGSAVGAGLADAKFKAAQAKAKRHGN
jgi:hypothetical protein